jgi:hypothetical protein
MRIALIVALLLVPAFGGGAAAQHRWGAIAFGPDGETGYAINQSSAARAAAAAFAACGSLCDRMLTFAGGCAAVALSPAPAIGTSVTRHRAHAAARALSRCERQAGGCALIAAVCTGRGTEADLLREPDDDVAPLRRDAPEQLAPPAKPEIAPRFLHRFNGTQAARERDALKREAAAPVPPRRASGGG